MVPSVALTILSVTSAGPSVVRDSFLRFGRAFRHFDGSIRRSDDSFRHFAGPFVVGDSFRRFNVASVALTILSVTSVEPSVVRDSFLRFGRAFLRFDGAIRRSDDSFRHFGGTFRRSGFFPSLCRTFRR